MLSSFPFHVFQGTVLLMVEGVVGKYDCWRGLPFRYGQAEPCCAVALGYFKNSYVAISSVYMGNEVHTSILCRLAANLWFGLFP